MRDEERLHAGLGLGRRERQGGGARRRAAEDRQHGRQRLGHSGAVGEGGVGAALGSPGDRVAALARRPRRAREGQQAGQRRRRDALGAPETAAPQEHQATPLLDEIGDHPALPGIQRGGIEIAKDDDLVLGQLLRRDLEGLSGLAAIGDEGAARPAEEGQRRDGPVGEELADDVLAFEAGRVFEEEDAVLAVEHLDRDDHLVVVGLRFARQCRHAHGPGLRADLGVRQDELHVARAALWRQLDGGLLE